MTEPYDDNAALLEALQSDLRRLERDRAENTRWRRSALG